MYARALTVSAIATAPLRSVPYPRARLSPGGPLPSCVTSPGFARASQQDRPHEHDARSVASLSPAQKASASPGIGQQGADVGQELRALLPVEHPVVEGQRELTDLADGELSVDHPGASLIEPSARIAAWPGIDDRVPVSMPNTPTLVMVKVPPVICASVVCPSRAVAVKSAGRRQAGQIQRSRRRG